MSPTEHAGAMLHLMCLASSMAGSSQAKLREIIYRKTLTPYRCKGLP